MLTSFIIDKIDSIIEEHNLLNSRYNEYRLFFLKKNSEEFFIGIQSNREQNWSLVSRGFVNVDAGEQVTSLISFNGQEIFKLNKKFYHINHKDFLMLKESLKDHVVEYVKSLKENANDSP